MTRKCRQANSIYIYGEGASGIKKRIQALEKEHSTQEKEHETPLSMRFIPYPVNFQNNLDTPLLIKQLKDMDFIPGFITIDTLVMSFGDGDENSSKDMNHFIRNLSKSPVKNLLPETN